MGTPVVILPSGGIAVTESPNGIPLTEATNGRGFAVTFVASGGLPVTGIVSGPSIQLSASSVAENASIATVVGTLSVIGGTGTYTFTLTDSSGGKFVLGGTNNSSLRTAALLDYETASSHIIAVSATNGVTPITAKNFTIIVTDISETVYLLTMGSGSFVLAGSNMEIIEVEAGAYVGPGDVAGHGTAYAYWGLRAYKAAYASALSPIIDIVDQAGANSLTVNSLSNGALNVAAINTWVTANSVTTIRVSKLYDQVGTQHLNIAVGGSNLNRPHLILSGVGFGSIPVMEFNTAGPWGLFTTSNATTQIQPFTLSAVMRNPTFATDGRIFSNSGAIQVAPSSAGNMFLYAGTGLATGPVVPDMQWGAMQAVFTGAASTINSSNSTTNSAAVPTIVSTNPGAGGLGNSAQLAIGVRVTGSSSGDLGYNGHIFELMLIPSAVSPANQVLMATNQRAVWEVAAAAPFAIDGPANGVTANIASGSGDLALPALSTTYANDLVLVAVVSNGYPVLTPTSPNLTFARHPSLTPPNNGTSGVDLFYAVAAAPLVSEVITVHMTGWMFTTGLAFALSGADTTTLFDTNASIPEAFTTDAPISTDASDTFCFGISTSNADGSSGTSPAYTRMNSTANSNYLLLNYRFNTSPAVAQDWTTTVGVSISTAVRKAGSWSPGDLPNLVAWYKADAGVYSDAGTTLATDGQKVRQWNDQSGNGYHIGNSDSNHQPVYQATSWTGSKKAVYFDPAVGNEATLQTAMGVAMGTGSAFSAFAMCQLETGSSANGRVIVYASGTNADYQGGGGILLSRNGSTQAIQTYRNGSTAGMALPAYSTDTRMGFIGSGTVTTPYINNAAGSTGADTQVFATGGKIGVGGAVTGGAASPDNNSYWKGKIAEIVLTKAALTTDERNALDAYFTSRWS